MTPRPGLWPDPAHASSPWTAMASHAPPAMCAAYEEVRRLRYTAGIVTVAAALVFPARGVGDGSSTLDWAPKASSGPYHTLDTILDFLRGAVGR